MSLLHPHPAASGSLGSLRRRRASCSRTRRRAVGLAAPSADEPSASVSGGDRLARQHPVSMSFLGIARGDDALELDPLGRRGSVSGAPSAWDYLADRVFRDLAVAAIWLILFLLAFILWSIGGKALVAMHEYGVAFLVSTTWDVGRGQFGILPHIWCTLYSALLALAVGVFFGVGMAIFLTQDFLPPRLAQVFRTIVELLAAIPSVVYGLWGLFVVVPAMRPTANWLYEHLGWIPLFGSTLSGPGMAPAGMVLAIMVLPTVAAV